MTKALRQTLRAASFSLIVVLAACADGGNTDEPAATAADTAQQQAANTATQQGQSQDRINLANCAQPANGRVFFQVGNKVLGVSAPTIRDAIPASLRPPINKDQVKSELQSQAAAGGGCPGKPIVASLLVLNDDLGHPLLDGQVGLLGTPPEGMTQRFADVTRNLQQKPTQNCRQMGGGLMGCIGTETRGNAQTQVMYVITMDPAQRMSTGGPLAARCVLKDNTVQRCNLVDELAGNIAFDATLKAGNYTAKDLEAARTAAIAKLDALSRTQ